MFPRPERAFPTLRVSGGYGNFDLLQTPRACRVALETLGSHAPKLLRIDHLDSSRQLKRGLSQHCHKRAPLAPSDLLGFGIEFSLVARKVVSPSLHLRPS